MNEVGGGSASAYVAICGHEPSEFDRVRGSVRSSEVEDFLEMPAADWRIIFDAVHAAMYALGPLEVSSVLGSSLVELADVNLRISVDVWGAYGGSTWAEPS